MGQRIPLASLFLAWRRAMDVPVANHPTQSWCGCLALAMLLWLAWPATGRAETMDCQALTVPTTITVPGHYCLVADSTQAFSLWAIAIAADDVVLDCNHHRLRNTDAASAWPGIRAEDRHRVTVRNCVIDGFHDGISFGNNGAGNADVSLLGNQVLNFRQQGMVLWGSSFRVEGNRISQGLGNDNGGIVGIYLISFDQKGAGTVIRDNVISGLRPPPGDPANDVMGIFLANVQNTEISGNVISDLHARTNHCAWAVYGSGAVGVLATGNTLQSALQPEAAPYDGTPCGGISLFGTVEQQATNVCRDNVVGHFNTDITGCGVSDANTGF
jgi:hypothetical protein